MWVHYLDVHMRDLNFIFNFFFFFLTDTETTGIQYISLVTTSTGKGSVPLN